MIYCDLVFNGLPDLENLWGDNLGIHFYPQKEKCIQDYEREPWLLKALYLIHSLGSTIYSFLHKKLILPWSAAVKPYEKSEGLNKQRLVVCLHGLNNNPTQFTDIVEELDMSSDWKEKTDLYIPAIRDKGKAELDRMVNDVLQVIKTWAEKGENKELVLVGISNGARIATAIEVRLAQEQLTITKFKLISIVGACYGSSLASLAHKVGLSWLMPRAIREEMPEDSERNSQTQEALNNSKPTFKRSYVFIATPHDVQVPGYSSTLREVDGANAVKYALVPGYTHDSIVPAVSAFVAQEIRAADPL